MARMKKTLAKMIGKFFCAFYKMRYGGRIKFGKNVILNDKFRFRGKGRLIIHDDANLWCHKEPNVFQTFDPGAKIEIGARTRLNGASIQARKSISVGEDCLVGSAIIMDNDFHAVHFAHRNDREFIKTKPVVVGNKVWIAGQSAVLKGVTVGDEAVIGFRAVVTKDVPAKTVVAGNPAREIGSLTQEKNE
jgi:acetyltransferase-like isoleucine patch superfamily enzyme